MCSLSFRTLGSVAVGFALAVQLLSARADVKVEFDKNFDFRSIRTWSWSPTGAGDVKMARTINDDPDAVKQQFEPILLDAVAKEMKARGLVGVTEAGDVQVTYYLLLSTTMSAQTLGQFLPATPEWGLPPFAPATQSIEMMNKGSLVLDLSVKEKIVWRGVAQEKVKFDVDNRRREELLREGVRDLLRRYPPRR